MKKLNVPLFLQPKGSLDCGPTFVRMILAYYGIEKTLDELRGELHYDPKIGTSIYDNGSLLIKNGLQVTAITATPMMFPPDVQARLKFINDFLKINKAKQKSN